MDPGDKTSIPRNLRVVLLGMQTLRMLGHCANAKLNALQIQPQNPLYDVWFVCAGTLVL